MLLQAMMGPIEYVRYLVVLLAGSIVNALDMVQRAPSAEELHPQLAALPEAERQAVTTWLHGAAPDDPLVIVTRWDTTRLAQLGTTAQAVMQLLLANGARATACQTCVFFTSVPEMQQCWLAVMEQAPDLFGFSTATQQQAVMQAMGVAAGVPAPVRVADTLTVYAVSSRAATVQCEVQFFAV